MNCQDLIKILREFPEGAEVLIEVDGAHVPLMVEHIQVDDGRVVITVTETQAAAEHLPVTPKRKKAK